MTSNLAFLIPFHWKPERKRKITMMEEWLDLNPASDAVHWLQYTLSSVHISQFLSVVPNSTSTVIGVIWHSE